MISADAMRQHILDIWGGEDEIEWCARPSQAKAMREMGIIRIPRIKSGISYAVALHEIGHIHGRHQQSGNTLVRERWAWTPVMERRKQTSLAWYVKRLSVR